MSDLSISDSILPVIDKFKSIKNINSGKYTLKQFNKIKTLLAKRRRAIRVMTYNMLFDLEDKQQKLVNRWPERLPRAVKLIENIKPDILLSQELRSNQLFDFYEKVKKNYGFFGENHKKKNCSNINREINAIFFRKSRFKLLEKESWVISHPNKNKKFSDTNLVMVKLFDQKTKNIFLLFNTHLDYYSSDNREFTIEIILKKIKKYLKAYPVILAGDFNTMPQILDLVEMPFYDGDYLNKIIAESSLLDAKHEAVLGHLGPLSTFTDFHNLSSINLNKATVTLDHIYITRDISVIIHAVEPAKINGHFPSDHMPVIIDCILGFETSKRKHKNVGDHLVSNNIW